VRTSVNDVPVDDAEILSVPVEMVAPPFTVTPLFRVASPVTVAPVVTDTWLLLPQDNVEDRVADSVTDMLCETEQLPVTAAPACADIVGAETIESLSTYR